MSEQNKKIEDAFHEYLTGDELKNAISLAEFLRANEMVYDGDYGMRYKGELACYINTPSEQDKQWGIWTVGDYSNEYEGFPIDERTKEIA